MRKYDKRTGYKINVLNTFIIMAITMWKCQKKFIAFTTVKKEKIKEHDKNFNKKGTGPIVKRFKNLINEHKI